MEHRFKQRTFARPWLAIPGLWCALLTMGCHHYQPSPVIGPAPPVAGPNFVAPVSANSLFQAPQVAQTPGATPVTQGVLVPVVNEDYTWEQIVDVVDDYFRIDQENRVQLVGNVVTEGRIDTFPQVGSTVFEPQRLDSVGRYNLFESTFQSIRRRAEIRVIPQQGGWFVEAIVQKEIEDLPRPENSTAGAASFRSDNSLQSNLREPVSRTRMSNYWIPLGRDCEVELQLLEDIQARLTTPVP